MGTQMIKNPKKGTDSSIELNSSFLLHNGFDSLDQISDIEMIAIQSVNYTSLKDLLPTSPLSIASPTHNSGSWHEIPIKNPLVKQAALAYLQPMSTPLEVEDKGWLGRLKDKCCGECGCFAWLSSAVLRSLRETFLDDPDDFVDDKDDGNKVD